MAKLEDPEQLALIEEALRERAVNGYVQWLRLPAEWLRKELAGYSQLAIVTAMYEHAKAGRKIDRVRETRPPWCYSHDYHFDYLLTIEGRQVYIETVLDNTRTGPTITIVNMH